MRKYALLSLCFFLLRTGFAQLSSPEIDALVQRTLKTFDVPGIAVAVIKDGKVVHSKGYGVRSLKTSAPVTGDTRFGIASNSKAFTAAALGLLMEEGKFSWDSKVTDFLPEFKMYDPYVTAEFTIRDLLTHRSGLGLGAGDLMFWPDENTFSKADIIHNLRFLKPVSSFRTKYDYDNLLYIVAGEIVARVSGKSWEDFIEERFLAPLGIQGSSAAAYTRLGDKENVIDPHFYVDGKLQVIRRDWSENANAAGGIYSSVNDMSKWVLALLNGGKVGDKVLLKPETLKEVWTPQTLLPVGNPGPYNTQFSAYGLGWVINDVKGYKQVSHTGGLAGIVTQTVLIPELKLGILVYTNQQSGAAFSAISNTIKDAYLGFKGQADWVDFYHKRVSAAGDNAKDILEKVQSEVDKNRTPPEIGIEGIYTDAWFGDAVVEKKNGQWWFTSKRSQRLTGPLYYYKGNTYVVRWTDRSMEADAFLVFHLDTEGQAAGIRLSAISPLTDFSFDFQDLNFTKK